MLQTLRVPYHISTKQPLKLNSAQFENDQVDIGDGSGLNGIKQIGNLASSYYKSPSTT